MGRFFSNINIKNNWKSSQQFIELLNKSMEKRGLIPATEEDESISYALVFPENDDWLTICSPDYESDEACVRSDVQWLAETLNTCCISTTIVDSDFSILEMYNGTSSMTDMVIVGDGSGYGFDDDTAFKGKQECWEPFLTENGTWEQLSKIWDGDFTFTEDALIQMASLFDMDSKNIVSGYNDLSSSTDKNIVELHFKKKEKKNALSLNAAFKQVFGEVLEPLGFVKIKGKQPYFVRVVEGGEIIHIITYINEPMRYLGQKEFCIFGGVATVYRHRIDLSISPKDNSVWLNSVLQFYAIHNRLDFDCDFSRSIARFSYKVDNEESMIDVLQYSLEVTEEFIIPIFNKTTNLNECVEYFNTFHPAMLNLYVKTDFGNKYAGNFYNEGLLYIKTNNQEAKEKWKKILDEKIFDAETLQKAASCYKFFSDPKLHAKILAELERRKASNTDILRTYGLNL